VTTSSNVGLLPTATWAGARTPRPIMSSVQGDPGRGPAGVGGAGGSTGVVGGVGVRTAASEGTTRSSCGTSVRVLCVVEPEAELPAARPVQRVQPSHPAPASRAIRTSSTTRRRRQ
jgi:hypothetical protein